MANDLRYALRTLSRSPGFTLSAVLALALAIGANSAVFSVVQAVLLNPLPYRQPDRLIRIWETNAAQGIGRGDVSAGSFVDWRTRSRTLEHVALFMSREWSLSVDDDLEILPGALVSPSVFPTLGVAPVLGRSFRPEAEQAQPFGDPGEVVIGYALWQRRFGGRPDVLGRTVTFEGRSLLTIVGVMPPGFDFPSNAQFWRSITFLRSIGIGERSTRYYECLARIRPGATLTETRAELDGIARQLESEDPKSNAGYGVRIERLDEATVGSVKPALLVLLGVAGCVLLIACTNVASLVLARATSRSREVAVRFALGAERWRLLRQSLTDGLVLAALGGASGLILGYWGMRALVALAPPDTPRLDEAGFGGGVVLLVAALATTAACLIGVVPLLGGTPSCLSSALRDGGRPGSGARRSLRAWLTGAEVALTLVLLVGAALLLRSFIALRHVDLGFDRERVLTADLRLGTARFPDDRRPWFKLGQHYDRVLAELATLPGVEAAGAVTGLPLTGESPTGKFWKDEGSLKRPDATKQFDVGISIVTPSYFSAMGTPLKRGRGFDAADRLTEQALTSPGDDREAHPAGVAIVNESLARRYWPGDDALGQTIVLSDHWAASSSTIVGIVSDVRASAVDTPAGPTVYVPWGEIPGFRLSVGLRTRVDAGALAPALRDRVRRFDSQMIVSNVRTLEDVVAGAVSKPRFNLVLVASFALLALALAAIGIYAVIAYFVSQRTREIGIRMALGARPGDVIRLVLGEGLRPVFLGVLAGAVVAAGTVRLMRTLLFGIAPLDPLSFVLAALTMIAVAVVAAVLPARRAARVDPLVALRDE